MKYLVTGGAGFIGTHLTEALLRNGHEVVVLDNLSGNENGWFKLLVNSDLATNLKFINGSITNTDSLLIAMLGCSGVFHLAALTSVRDSMRMPQKYLENNLIGSVNVFDVAKMIGVPKIVFASSAAVYGDADEYPVSETSPLRPESQYARTKAWAEDELSGLVECYGMNAVILRYFNVFGTPYALSPKQSSVIFEMTKNILTGKPPVIYGDGDQTRDFISVSDVVNATIIAMENKNAKGIYNIGSGIGLPINFVESCVNSAIMRKLSHCCDYCIPELYYGDPEYRPSIKGEIRKSCANTTAFYNATGWSASPNQDVRMMYCVEETIERTMKARLDKIKKIPLF